MSAQGKVLRDLNVGAAFEARTQSSRFHRLKDPYVLAVATAIVLGFIVRAFHILSSDFPLNDGGLFYVMVRDLQQAHYALPRFTSYNAAGVPYAYSPLAFYIAGILDDLTPLSLLEVFRILPLITSTLAIVAFFLLARSLLPSRLAAVAATFAFALIPRSFIWLLMGGGITRSLGLLFALLALHQVHKLYTTRASALVFPVVLLSGLTILSHLETALFLAFSSALFFVAYGRHSHGFVASVMVAAGTALVTAPWWIAVTTAHGFDVFLSAQQAVGSSLFQGEAVVAVILSVLRLVYTGEQFFPIIGGIAILGMLVCLSSRRLLLPSWWIGTLVLDLRAGHTFITLPVALLAGVGFVEVVLPALRRSISQERMSEQTFSVPDSGIAARMLSQRRLLTQPVVVVSILLLCYAAASAITRRSDLQGEAAILIGLAEGERTAMAWVARETPPSSRFLVIPITSWPIDKTTEWFPALAERTNMTTVQGYEWLADNAFNRRTAAHERAIACGFGTAACLDQWSRQTGTMFTHVYLIKGRSGALYNASLASSLKADSRYQEIYDGPGAIIFVRQ